MSSNESNTIKLKKDILPYSVPEKKFNDNSIDLSKTDFKQKMYKVKLPEISYEKRKKEKLSRDKIIQIVKKDKNINSKECPENVTMEMLIDVMGGGIDMEHHVKNNDKDALWNVYYEYLIIHVLSKD